MNVDELQLQLSNLAHLLKDAGGRKIADALDEFCQRLQPYRDRKVKDLLDLVAKADEIVRTGVPPTKPRKTAAKADPEALARLQARIIELYQRASDPSVTRELVEDAFQQLEKANLTVPQLQELARRMDIQQRFRAKKELLETMKRAVLERKGVFERVGV